MFWHHHFTNQSVKKFDESLVWFPLMPRMYINNQTFGSKNSIVLLYSVQLSCSVVSNPLWPHEPQHARPPCSSLASGVHPNPCPSSQWCHPTISSSVITFSSCFQSFPAQGLFKWVSSSHQVAEVLEFQLQHQSFQ